MVAFGTRNSLFRVQYEHEPSALARRSNNDEAD